MAEASAGDRRHRLVLMRHAEAAQSGATDGERPLTESGIAAAREAGAWLAAQQIEPDAALVSAARRAQQTWASFCAGAGCNVDVGSAERALYASGPESVLDLVGQVSEEVHTLVVVGHNPTMSVLAMTLDDGSTSILLENSGFPAGTLVVFEFQGPWSELTAQGASAVNFHVGLG